MLVRLSGRWNVVVRLPLGPCRDMRKGIARVKTETIVDTLVRRLDCQVQYRCVVRLLDNVSALCAGHMSSGFELGGPVPVQHLVF